MIKKSDLRSVFEWIVEHRKKVITPIGVLDVLTWLITLDESVHPSIRLNAVTKNGLVCEGRSFPFGSYKSAYQFLVRL